MQEPTLTVRVARKSREAIDICSLDLVDPSGADLPVFSPGSHIDVHLPGGLVRQYSLCNSSSERQRYVIGVLRDPNSRGGSKDVHDAVHEGDTLRIGAPRNHFEPAQDATRSLLLAGGIGVTPLLSMAERLASTGAAFDMHYCTRARDRTAFRARIQTSGFAERVQFHFDEDGESGQLDLHALLASPQAGTHLYVCGPKGFMDAVLGAARAAGWPEAQIHFEFFGASVDLTAVTAEFSVKLASTGRIVTVARDKSVTTALAAAGIDIPVSCEQGVCGTCITRVLDGVPDHKDMYLSPQEQARNDQFTPCCSRSLTPMLVLDL